MLGKKQKKIIQLRQALKIIKNFVKIIFLLIFSSVKNIFGKQRTTDFREGEYIIGTIKIITYLYTQDEINILVHGNFC